MRKIWFALPAICLAAGCFLEPRSPETGGGEVCFKSTPSREFQTVFTNMDGALGCFLQGIYEAQLSESDFEFIPSASALAENPDAFATEWDFARESAWLNELFANSDSLVAALRIRDISPPAGNTTSGPLLVEATYRVRQVPAGGGGAVVYRGEALYTLEVSAANWVMTRWEEKESAAGDVPLGNLRGGLAP